MAKDLIRKLDSYIHISLISAGNIFNAFLGFLFLSSVAKTVTLNEFGVYALLTSIIVAIAKIMDFGTNYTFVAKSIIESKSLESTLFTLRFLITLALVPISVLILLSININNLFIVGSFILGMFGYLVNLNLFGYFLKRQDYFYAILVNTLPAVIKGGVGFLSILGILNLSLVNFFFVFCVSLFSSLIILFKIKDFNFNLNFDLKEMSVLLKESFYYGLSSSISAGWPAIANGINKFFKTFSEVGVFSLADKIANIFSLISLSVFTYLLPKNSKFKKENKNYDVKEIVGLSIGVLFLATIATQVAPSLITAFFESKFEESKLLFNILVFSASFAAIQSFLENFYIVDKKTKTIFYINLFKMGLFILLAVILIPYMNLYGLAYAQIIANLASLILVGVSLRKALN